MNSVVFSGFVWGAIVGIVFYLVTSLSAKIKSPGNMEKFLSVILVVVLGIYALTTKQGLFFDLGIAISFKLTELAVFAVKAFWEATMVKKFAVMLAFVAIVIFTPVGFSNLPVAVKGPVGRFITWVTPRSLLAPELPGLPSWDFSWIGGQSVDPATINPSNILSPEEGCTLQVTANVVNVRQGPTTETSVVGQRVLGDIVSPLAQNEDFSWTFVQTGNLQGWIKSSLLTQTCG